MNNLKDILRNIRDRLRAGIVFDIRSIFRKTGVADKNNKLMLESIKNKYNGERCFIVATGPSLSKEDVRKIKGEYTFGVNSLFNVYDEYDFRPSFYVCGDYNVYKDQLNNKVVCAELAKDYVFFTDLIINDFDIKGDKIIKLYLSQINNLNHFNPKKFKYSTDLVKGIYTALTVVNTCICVASYLGFKEIYLLGVDCNYLGEMKHIGEDKPENITDKVAIERATKMKLGYSLVHEKCKENNVKVYNATRGGCLEEFERVNLEDIIE